VTAPAPRVWMLTGDKTGDNAQLAMLAEAVHSELGWPVEHRQLAFRPGFRRGKPLFLASTYHVDRRRSDALEPPWPDLLLTVGLRPAMVALWIKRRSAGRTRVVLLGRPKRGIGAYDLVLAPVQYQLPDDPAVLRLSLPLMRPDGERLEAAARDWQSAMAARARPLVAVLVGAATRPYRFGAEEVTALIDRARSLADGGNLWITTSRRTPAAVRAALRRQLEEGDACFEFGSSAPNPYLGLLAHADRFLVTGDSVSMLTEVASLGRPLAIFELPVRAPRRRRLLARCGAALGRRPGAGALRRLAMYLGLSSYPRDLGALHGRLRALGLAAERGAMPCPSAGLAAEPLGPVLERIAALGSEALGSATARR